jgi:hypothetical protein
MDNMDKMDMTKNGAFRQMDNMDKMDMTKNGKDKPNFWPNGSLYKIYI